MWDVVSSGEKPGMDWVTVKSIGSWWNLYWRGRNHIRGRGREGKVPGGKSSGGPTSEKHNKADLEWVCFSPVVTGVL